MHKHLDAPLPLLKPLRQRRKPRIPVQNNLALVLNRPPAVVLVERERRQVDGRRAQEQEVARARGVGLVEQVGVHGEDGVVERAVVQPPAVADVVDADEEGEERRGGGPGDACRGGGVRAVRGQEFRFDLVFEREDGWRVGRYEGGVDGGAAVGEVVGE